MSGSELKHFQIHHGDPPKSSMAPVPTRIVTKAPGSVALLGRDLMGLRPRLEVKEGDEVARGQRIFVDRKQSTVAYVSPISGVVSDISLGPRRTLSSFVISDNGTANEICEPVDSNDPRKTLQSRGLWPAFRTRPFGRTPAPDAVPQAIVINAVHADPEVPDPVTVLADQCDAFHRGALLLTRLTPGTVYLCQSPGKRLGPNDDGIEHASFGGTIAAGFSGTQIDRLCPVDRNRMVWSIGYQDVAAIGHLIATQTYAGDRVVANTDSSHRSQLVRLPLGANIADISDSGFFSPDVASLYLGRFDVKISQVPTTQTSAKRDHLARLFPRQKALVPMSSLDSALAVDVLPIPLMRALSIGDSESADLLGCLALVEEDMAAVSARCVSGADYGALLRDVLDDLESEAT